jgi:hypothetical protein
MLKILNAVFLIPWKTLEPGMSFFVPCLSIAPYVQILEAEAIRWRKSIVYKRVVENGKYGLRVWIRE